jgi:[ribosomal protein S5]-alanine N-acetyltransferase
MATIPNLTNQRALEHLIFWRENHKRERKAYPKMIPTRKPRFDYQNLPDSERLSYELFSWDNFKQMLDLFENDPSPYVNEEFKSLERLEDYAVSQLEYNCFSFKRGACDWFLHKKESNELVGVLHIYALNWELYSGKHPACMIGHAIAEKYRRQGFAFEAMTHLLDQIPVIFKRYEVEAHFKIANSNSQALLTKLGFTEDRKAGSDATVWSKQLIDTIPLKTYEDVCEEEKKYR